MKLYKLLPLVFLAFVFLPNSEAICCGTGCSPTSNICCTPEEGGDSVGYVGCWDARVDGKWVCPEDAIGCLECGVVACTTTVECNWDPVTSGICNGCEITERDENNYPLNSECSANCGSGEERCDGGSCQVDCDIPETVPPNCDPNTNSDSICCVDPDNNPDGICDTNCHPAQDLDCGGGDIGDQPGDSCVTSDNCQGLLDSNLDCVDIGGDNCPSACTVGTVCTTANDDCSGTYDSDCNCIDIPADNCPSTPENQPGDHCTTNDGCAGILNSGLVCTGVDGDNCPPIGEEDDDNDGIPNEDDPDQGGGGPNPDGDGDGDGIPNGDDPDDDNDGIPDNEDPDDDNDGVPDNEDPDDDNDGVPDDDGDNDGIPNGDDPDDDNDGIPDSQDPDDDNDGVPDDGDIDDDNDGIPDPDDKDTDNDLDDDGIPNGQDPDDDGDGIPDITDPDDDNDGVLDIYDPDDDNDGTPDIFDPDMPGPGEGVTCTKNEGDCCSPLNDNICDPDCVEGVDPKCKVGSPFGNDGLCNADSDGICDINCFEGIDTPDCDDFLYTPNNLDGCLPSTDGSCDTDCPLNTDLDCTFAPGLAQCDNNGVCEDFEGCHCNDCIANPTNACITGLFCCSGVCSGDTDNDLICDAIDYCIHELDPAGDEENQRDTDLDCYEPGTELKSPIFGFCGDSCDLEDVCFDIYGSKQCCDELPGSEGTGTFIGYTADCPNIGEYSVGCWSICKEIDEQGNIITYEIGQCIEGTKSVTKLKNNIPVEILEEPCTSIPLIPFYTNFSIIATLLVLISYYRRKQLLKNIYR